MVENIGFAGDTALAVGADVPNGTVVEKAVDKIVEELGAPIVLINNAGVTRNNLLFKMTAAE